MSTQGTQTMLDLQALPAGLYVVREVGRGAGVRVVRGGKAARGDCGHLHNVEQPSHLQRTFHAPIVVGGPAHQGQQDLHARYEATVLRVPVVALVRRHL